MDAAAEVGRNPVYGIKCTRFSLSKYGDEQADAGQDCRTRLARPNSQARTNADRDIFNFPSVQLTTSRVGNLNTRLIQTLAICVTIHRCTIF